MTPEELAEIEARVRAVEPWCTQVENIWTICNEDAPALVTALKEAWAENERFKLLLSRERAAAWEILAEHHDDEAGRHRQKAHEAYANVESYRRSQMPEELEKP